MTRTHFAALAVVALLAAWMLVVRQAPLPDEAVERAGQVQEPEAANSCRQGDECRIGDPGAPAPGPEAASEAAAPRSAPPSAETAAAPAPAGEPTATPPSVSPAEAAALRAEADRLLDAGDFRGGLDRLRRATEADPSARNHGDLGALLARLTDFDGAARHLREAAEKDPGNADRWIALANVYYRKVDLGQAWAAERRAREAEPGLELGRDAGGMRVRKGDTAPRKP